MPLSPVISVVGLTKTYSEGWIRRRKLDVLKGLTFDVGQGEIFGLLGPNGAGKTTFIKILLGIVRRSSGSATLLGYPAGSRPSRRLVGYLPENLRIARHHTARSALAFYGRLSGVPADIIRSRGGDLLKTVGLAERADDSIAKYSKGMLQRLGLAQALLPDPQLVILDEPTDGLDPLGRSHVRTVLQKLKQEGRTVFVNSHILQEVELVCDRVAILDRGVLRFVGPVEQITQSVTANGEIQLDLELAGTAAQIRAALANRMVEGWEALPTAGSPVFKVAVRTGSQADVDSVVDQLRAAQVSVIRLDRRRVSLEQAFLSLVEGIDQPLDVKPLDEHPLAEARLTGGPGAEPPSLSTDSLPRS